jgi:hypothetical protein
MPRSLLRGALFDFVQAKLNHTSISQIPFSVISLQVDMGQSTSAIYSSL